MPRRTRTAAALAMLAVLGAAALVVAFRAPAPVPPQAAAGGDEAGRAVYTKWCAGCHGDEGKGDGPGASRVLPKPRDFTRALYQIRSTNTGEVPTDDDLRHVIDYGMPGTSMPGWRTVLSSDERAALVRYVKSFSSAFANAPTAISYGSDPGGGRAAIDSGRALYTKIQCFKCHGDAGRGNGQSAPTLKDDFNFPIRAANLTQNWLFNGGGSVEDIYHRLRTGLDGTPMPTFSDQIDARILTDGDIWRVAHYVRSLAPADSPQVRDLVAAPRISTALPSGPADSAWADVDQYWFPLVGQVVVKPRWFAPMVTGVWVQAVHDGASLAIRVSWSDPSRSPDPAWRAWRGRLARSMHADDSTPVDTASALPDRLVLQFPARLADGMERPYFLMGSAEQSVYLWRWESEPGAATEARGQGADHVEPLPSQPDSVSATGSYDDGEWRVQFTRSLTTADSTDRLQFVAGRPIPMAVFAWDGSNGETGTRMAIGSWVGIHLGEPASAATIVWPLLAVVTTGGLGMAAVARAQRAAGKRTDTSEEPS